MGKEWAATWKECGSNREGTYGRDMEGIGRAMEGWD
jgi:hypothetical protein